MPKRYPKFIAEYLIPSLNSQRFGKHLKWLDKKKNIFQLNWCHKGDKKHWSEENNEVFVGWDKIKGHYQPDEKNYFSRSKQRFRALLYKLTLEGQLKEVQCDTKSKKNYCITGEKKVRRKTPSSSTDSGVFSTDDISSDENEIIEDLNSNGMNEFGCVTEMNNLDDHNYCKYLIGDSDTRFKHPEALKLPIFTNESVEPGKKVVVEQSYPYNHYDTNTYASKEKNIPSCFSQSLLEDLTTGSKNAVLIENDGFVYGLDHCSGFSINQTPMKSTESFNGGNEDMNVQFEKFLSGLKMDDFSNLNTFWKQILSWP